MSFPERYGYKLVREALQINSLDHETSNKIWNDVILCVKCIDGKRDDGLVIREVKQFNEFFNRVVSDIAHKPLDDFGDLYERRVIVNDWDNYVYKIQPHLFNELKNWWHKEFLFPSKMRTLELLCISCSSLHYPFREKINEIFRKLLVGYRVNNKNEIMRTNSDEELESIEQAAKETTYIDEAISQLKNENYRNSIKESMSAVEDVCKKFLGDESKNTLGENLKIIGGKFNYHPVFLSALNKLYGFSSDEKGVRHAGNTESDIGQEESYFVLITCSAFINYLKEKERNN